ncbi:uncharacterized protein LOC108098168 [Drosophila ficusphila]|uniref:uncharacterized protein LOC108098168 n=1 Tax=Drosophila ficusphila TaxID=30025 RepID=UPI001C894910|nr:uncharacterized protein LOC108098168 [Drosophila ficusphila]
MNGLIKRRLTAQQILLRRALSKSVGRCQDATEFVRDGIAAPPSLVKPAQERSSSRAVRKLHRILASNPFGLLGERKTGGTLSGCDLQRKDSRSWRKLKPSENHPNLSRNSSRGSSRSRNSASIYPSTWQLNVSKAKDELKENSQGSLEEIVNCAILNRTPYDHKLSTPLKSDNSCQCTIKKKSRRRGRKTKTLMVAQTQTITETERKGRNFSKEKYFQGRSCSKDSDIVFQKLDFRAYSGEEVCHDRRTRRTSSKSSVNSRISFKPECPGIAYKDYGGYSPSETDIEAECFPAQRSQSGYLDKITKISKPPSDGGSKWSLKIPSNVEINQYMARGSRERSPTFFQEKSPGIGEKMSAAKREGQRCHCSMNPSKVQDKIRKRSNQPQRSTVPRTMPKHRGSVSNEKRKCCNPCCPSNLREKSNRKEGKTHSQASISSAVQFRQRIRGQGSENSFNQKYEKSKCGNPCCPSKFREKSNRKEGKTHSQASNLPSIKFRQRIDEVGSENSFRQQYEKNSNEKSKCGNPCCPSKFREKSNRIEGKTHSQSSISPSMQLRQRIREEGSENSLCQQYEKNSPNVYQGSRHSAKVDSSNELMESSCICSRNSRERQANKTQDCNRSPSSYEPQIRRTKQQTTNSVVCDPKCTEAITQTSDLLMAPRSYGTKCNFQGVQQSFHQQANSVMPNKNQSKQECSRQENFGRTTLSSQEVDKAPRNAVQCRCKEIEHSQKSNSVNFKSPRITSLKTAKPSRTRKQRTNRSFSRCCCTRKKLVKKSTLSEKQKTSISTAKDQASCKDEKNIGGLPKIDKCDVRKILAILQQTLAGLEKQINNGEGNERGINKSKCVRNSKPKPKCCKVLTQLKDSHNENCNQVRTQKPPNQQGCSFPERNSFDHPLTASPNRYFFEDNSPNKQYQCSRTGPANFSGSTHVYESLTRSVSPVNIEESCRNKIMFGRSEYDYPKEMRKPKCPPYQEPHNKPITSVNNCQAQSNYSQRNYNNQSSPQYMTQPCASPQCVWNTPKMEEFRRNPIPNLELNQRSKGAACSKRQSPREKWPSPEYCPYKGMQKCEEGQIHQKKETFQPKHKTFEDSYFPNYDHQLPGICENPFCPKASKYSSSFDNESYPVLNRNQSIETVSDFSRSDPECPYKQNETNSGACKGPDYCPYQSSFKSDFGPNNRGVVTFRDMEKCRSHKESFLQIPTQYGDITTCPEGIQYSRSRDNPVFPTSKRTLVEVQSDIIECDPECVYQPFQKGGHADEHDNYCDNPYCQENVTLKNYSSLPDERDLCENPSCPGKESLYRNSINHQKDETLNKQKLCKERKEKNIQGSKKMYPEGSENNSNYACSNQRSEKSYFTEDCSPNCPARQKTGYNVMKRRVTVVRRDQESYYKCQNPQCPEKRIKSSVKPKQVYQSNQHTKLCENPNCSNKTTTNREGYSVSGRTYSESQTKSKKNKKVEDVDSCAKNSPNREFLTNQNSYEKDNYEHDYKACGNPDFRGKKGVYPNKYRDNAGHAFGVGYEIKHGGELCENPKCLDKKERYRKEKEDLEENSHRIPPCAERKRNSQEKNPNSSKQDGKYKDSQHIGDSNECSEEFDDRPRYRYVNRSDNLTKQSSNSYEVCDNPKCVKPLENVTNNNGHEKRRYENPGCDRFEYGYGRNSTGRERFDPELEDVCLTDSPNRQRVLFTNLRRFKNSRNNTSRQCSGRSDLYNVDRIAMKTFNKCNSMSIGDRQAINKFCNSRKTEAKNKFKPERSICICPGKPAPIFVKNRYNPFVTIPSLNSYEEYFLSNFQKFKEEKNKNHKCVGNCPFLMEYEIPSKKYSSVSFCKEKSQVYDILMEDKIHSENFSSGSLCRVKSQEYDTVMEDEIPSKKCSSGSLYKIKFQEHDIPCNCQSNEFNKHHVLKSKASIFSCVKSPKQEGKSKANIKTTQGKEITPLNKNSQEKQKHEKKTDFKNYEKPPSKSSGIGCLKKSDKKPQENPKSNDKEPTSKMSEILCLKKPEKRSQKNKPTIEKESQRVVQQKPSPQDKNQKNKDKNTSKRSSRRSGFFSWCRKSQNTQREYEKPSSVKECPCTKQPSPKDQESPMLKSGAPFPCSCAPRKSQITQGEEEKLSSVKNPTCSNHPSPKDQESTLLRSGVPFHCSCAPKKSQNTQWEEEKLSSVEECPCTKKPSPKDQESPMLKSNVPFHCACAPKYMDDGEVKVLYDSSFRFQKESCSCAEVSKTRYCHYSPSGQDTDWYEESPQESLISCVQTFQEEGIEYWPCASANGFYKIVR